MGWFDGLSAGWDSFKNNELKTVEKVVTSPNPVIQVITGNAGDIFDTGKSNEEKWENVGETLVSPNPIVQAVTGNASDIVNDNSLSEKWENVGETLVSPNPIISMVTGTGDNILSDKPVEEKWNETTTVIKETVVQPVETTIEKTIVQPVKETVKETVQNVTKGVGDALPIVAIGAAAIIGLSILFGRK